MKVGWEGRYCLDAHNPLCIALTGNTECLEHVLHLMQHQQLALWSPNALQWLVNSDFSRKNWHFWDNPRALTLRSQAEAGELAEDARGDEVDVARGKAGVVAQVRGLRLGDVKVARGLGDETSLVGRDEIGEFVQEPPVGYTWGEKERNKLGRFVLLGVWDGHSGIPSLSGVDPVGFQAGICPSMGEKEKGINHAHCWCLPGWDGPVGIPDWNWSLRGRTKSRLCFVALQTLN